MWSKLKNLKIGTVCLLVVAIIIASSFISQIMSIFVLHEEIDGLNKDKTELLQEQNDLKSQISLLNTNAYIEKLARENLGMIKPGELLYVPTIINSEVKEQSGMDSANDNLH